MLEDTKRIEFSHANDEMAAFVLTFVLLPFV